MNQTFPEFLNEVQADPDVIQQALRMYISERTNDLTREEMLNELSGAVTNKEKLEQQLKELGKDPAALEQVALIYFERAWQDNAQQPSIRAAFKHAKGKLPVIETAILAVVVMYGMYLITTNGVTESRIKRNADGSYEESKKREPFAPIVSAMARLFGKQE